MHIASRPGLILAVSLALAACSKVNVDNYNKLRVGQTYNEVQTLLGKPTRCSDLMTAKNCTWGDDKRYINVSFVADSVVLFGSENLR